MAEADAERLPPGMKAPWTWTGFSGAADYFHSLPLTFRLLRRRALYVRGAEHAEGDKGDVQLARNLGWARVMFLGVGMIIGAGVFVSTGAAAAKLAGPAVVLSFLVGGISSLLSALVYAEFAAEYPIAGGAFNYIAFSFGELAAFLVVTTLVMEYVLSQAAVARSFTFYFATLIGKPSNFFLIQYKDLQVDFMAGGLVLVLGILLAVTTVGGASVNLVVTLLQLVFIALILILGFIKANPANMSPFLPYGVRGIFDGASFVFFSFIGFDCVSTLAEETRNPAVDMPVGIVGCISLVTLIYVAMSLCIVLMVPYNLIDTGASFAIAMTQVGFPWASYVVALGALLGILTGVLANIMGVARILCSLARTHLAPPLFGAVHKRFLTPFNATVLIVVTALPLAILSDLPMLIDMVAAGTLLVFGVVALALIWHRYVPKGASGKDVAKPAAGLAVLTAAGVAFACVWGLMKDAGVPQFAGLGATGGVAIAATAFLALTGRPWLKPVYSVPLFPWTPEASYMLNCFLMASLPVNAYIQLAIFFAVMLAFYAVYSVHAANKYDDFLGRQPGLTAPPEELEGKAAADLEATGGPSRDHSGRAASAAALRRALSHRSSFVNPYTGAQDLRREIGRGSGAVPYLPPATLP